MEDLNFNIPKSDTDRLELLNLVKNSIKDPVKIVSISHKPYLEIYTFTDGKYYADIKIYFNGKHIISRVDNQTDSGISDFGIDIKSQLIHLEKKCILSENSSLPVERLDSVSNELCQFVKKLTDNGKKLDIKVLLTNIQDYNFTLTFFDVRNNRVQYKFLFNSKKTISLIQAINRDQSELFSVVDNLINEIQHSDNEENYDKKLFSSDDQDNLVEVVGVKIEKI